MSPGLFPTSVYVSLSKKPKIEKVLDTLAKLFTICKTANTQTDKENTK